MIIHEDPNLMKCSCCGNTADHYLPATDEYMCSECYNEYCKGVHGDEEETEFDYGADYWFDNPEDKLADKSSLTEGGLQ